MYVSMLARTQVGIKCHPPSLFCQDLSLYPEFRFYWFGWLARPFHGSAPASSVQTFQIATVSGLFSYGAGFELSPMVAEQALH